MAWEASHRVLPGIMQTDEAGTAVIAATNATGSQRLIRRGDVLGEALPIDAPESAWLTEQAALAHVTPVQPPEAPARAPPRLSQAQLHARRAQLRPRLQIACPPENYEDYANLLLEFADVFSLDDNDLGFSNVYEHRIDLTSDNPVHVQQFRIPLSQQAFVNTRVRELIDMNLVEPSTSPYNTPIFAVPKKTMPGEAPKYRLIQDLRALNRLTKQDKHTIMDVRACLDKIGELHAAVFSSIDLRAGYHQMGLAKDSRPYTAFTLPDLGQWQWRVTTMGLTGAPASFSRLMGKVMEGLHFILRYLDDLLAASTSHQQHLQHLRLTLERLRRFNLKINPDKSKFGAASVEYLGHTVSQSGFTIGEHKFAAVKDFPPPTSKQHLQQFLGLANYFRQLIPSYQTHAGHLSQLLAADNAWKAGPLPPRAALAFQTLRNALLSKPVITFPDPSRPFTLATDAAVGSPQSPGGLGAVLTQSRDGHDRVVAYASRALKQHEKTQSAFQLELQAIVWALNHFGPYLRHNTFTVLTDHKPVANLSQQQLKSLHRLHEKMLEFPCTIVCRPGILNDVADALSRNAAPVAAAETDHTIPNLLHFQDTDALCLDVRRVMDGLAPVLAKHASLTPLGPRFTRINGLLAIRDPQGIYNGHRIIAPSAVIVRYRYLKPSESVLNPFQIETLGIGNPCYYYLTLARG